MELKVIIDPIVHKKVMHWVNKSSFEVSGLGLVDTTEAGIIKVTDVILLPQKNASTTTDIEAEDVNNALFKFKDHPGELRWWWHSHVDMGVFWSGTDMDTIKKIGAGGWFLSTVFNKKNELRSAYYAKDGLVTPWGTQPNFTDNVSTIIGELKLVEMESWDKEYEENVTNVRYQPANHGWGGGYGFGYDDADNYGYSWARKRPLGMSRREWRRMKKDAENPCISSVPSVLHQPPAEIPKVEVTLDDYGFTQEDMTLLAENGWDIGSVDDLLVLDFTPNDIMSLVKANVQPTEASYLLTHGYKVDDVMALVNDSKVSERI